MNEKSMRDKVTELEFDPDEFYAECSKLDDMMIKIAMDNARDWNLQHDIEVMEKYGVYPQLRKLKAAYGIDVPITLFGFDIVALDHRIDSKLWDKRSKERTEKLVADKLVKSDLITLRSIYG
jgi:hypothetical protein